MIELLQPAELIKLQSQLIKHEGFVPHAYKDSEGWWTIGIGRLIDERKQGGITVVESLYLLNNDIEKRIKALDLRLSWWRTLDPVRQRILLEMSFQMGVDGLLGFTNTLKMIHDRRYNDAAEGMLSSLWAQQTPARAKRLSDMMKSGKDL